MDTGSPESSVSATPAAVEAGTEPQDDGVRSMPTSTMVDARPVAIVNGRQVTWGELRESMTESAGAAALQELILDRLLAAEMASANRVLASDAVNAEQNLLLSSLSTDRNTAQRLLNALRRRQELGPSRFDGLLRRNAQLRALVRDRVNVTNEQVQRRYDILYGPQRQARLITTPDLGSAQRLLQLIRSGTPFDLVATMESTDESAARGGLLEPISRDDAAYPAALRRVLYELATREISEPILLGDQYAILMLVQEFDASATTLEEVRSEVRQQVRLEQERLMMDELALRLLRSSSVQVYDATLRGAWQRLEMQRAEGTGG